MSADRFTQSDAAYALGALSDAERTEFETHLVTCADCRARVADAYETVALLGSPAAYGPDASEASTASADESLPQTLWPGLVRRARREQLRRQTVTASVATLAAACLIALLVAVWPSSAPSHPSAPPAQALSALVPIKTVSATAALQDRAWGTEIDVRCRHRHDGSAQTSARYRYDLRVVDRDGRTHVAGSWAQSDSTVYFTGGTEVRRERIAKVQVTLADGTPILQLTL